MTIFVLAAEHTEPRSRTLIDTADPGDDRLQKLDEFLAFVGLRQLSTSHQCHAISGPENPHFEAALEAYGLTWYKPCDEKIIQETMELLVAAELLEVSQLDDYCLRGLLAMGLANEDDWKNIPHAAEIAVRTHLANHFEGFSLDPAGMDADHLSAYSALVGGMVVAVTKARADWTV
jgi:hypothetical protein